MKDDPKEAFNNLSLEVKLLFEAYRTQIEISLNEAPIIYLPCNYNHDKTERKIKFKNVVYYNKSPFFEWFQEGLKNFKLGKKTLKPIIDIILNPKTGCQQIKPSNLSPTEENAFREEIKTLNESQKKALRNSAIYPFSLVRGPPG